MTAFFDTNVLIAASQRQHLHHEASLLRLAPMDLGSGACAAHTLAEVYSTLTKCSGPYRLLPSHAGLFVDDVRVRLTLITLEPAEYVQAIEQATKDGISGGLIYDALLLACARKIEAEWIYTWNVRHFRAIAPDLAERIVTP